MWATFLLLLLCNEVFSETVTRFTNIKCDSLDASFVEFKQCYLKVIGRGVIGLNLQATLVKGSFNNAKASGRLLRKYNTFRPIVNGATIDFCGWMGKGHKEISFGQFIADMFAESSNVNHSCPYENEILVRNLVLKEDHFKFLPLPTGEYQLLIRGASDGKWKANVYLNFLRKEDIIKNSSKIKP